ncbi:MAG TPA: LysE family transporter [Noviherbaspirillum sp.]|nr:LysE family transporter [Noviherbaspirillum sp.]
MSFSTWITFVFASALIAVSPGSGAVLAMSHGLSYGVRKASATILGLQGGLLLLTFIAGAGIGSVLLASEFAFSVVKVVGALYLIWLGFTQWRSPAAAVSAGPMGNGTVVPSLRKRVLTGFLTNATNPKGIVFAVAMLPQFISPHAPLLPQLLILGATSVAIDLVVMHGYAFAASSMQHWLASARAARSQNRFFGGVLMAVGATLFFVKRNPAA